MSPRTNSPTPPYGPYDDISDFDYPAGPSGHQNPYFSNISQANFYPSQQQNNITSNGSNVLRNDITGTSSTHNNSNSNNNNNERGLFTALLLRPLNIPRRVLSSSAVKGVSLMILYSFCITSVCFIFFVSYLLTFYDDTRRLFRSSRVWAQLKVGVRERIAMMGDDWEEFLQKYFDQQWDGVDVNRSAHLGNNNATNDSKRQTPPVGEIPKDLEWLKGAVLSFITVIAGQDVTNKFHGQPPTATTAGGDAGRK
uniref:Uncharacterized protein n=1 Tax=Anthurium amnicola TaxID=1678845 RepID=A0A1D1YJ96_9ARAE